MKRGISLLLMGVLLLCAACSSGKEALPTLPALADLLADLPVRCIVFVDDLSFRGDDERIASLKAMLEGGLAMQPDNLLIYATSNRLHLVRESDRNPEERHAADTVN